MKSITLGFLRKVGSFSEEKEDLSFQDGDCYNIYAHTVSDARPEGTEHFIERFSAFKINSITDSGVEIEKIYPVQETFSINLNETKTFEFGQYGEYSLTLKNLW